MASRLVGHAIKQAVVPFGLLALSVGGCARATVVSAPPALEPATLSNASGPEFSESQVDTPVRAVDFRAPKYPASLRSEGLCGSADITYVVGTNGKAEPPSIAVIAATRPAFGQAAADAIRASTFTPAIKHGQPVRQRVNQRATFSLGGVPGSSAPPPCPGG